jgi:ABC-type multidrug transport system fused ATPase/permease subunit
MTASTQPAISFNEYARFLTHYLRPRQRLVAALGVALLINIGLQLINPQIMRAFIDGARAGIVRSELTRMALTFIGVAVFQQLLGVLVVYIAENLGWATTNTLRLELAQHSLGLDMSFHAAHTPGEMIERIDGDVMALSNFFSQFILQVFGNLLLLIGVLAVLLSVDWRVCLSLGVFVALTIIVLLRLANISVSSWEAERQTSANLYGFLEERLSGTEDIRSNNAKHYVLDRFYRLTRDLMRKTLKAGLKSNVLLNTTWVLFAVGNAVALVVSAYLFHQNAITIGTVYMIVYYTNMLNWPLERITQQMQDVQKAGASLIRILHIRRIQGKIAGESDFAMPVQRMLPPGPLAVAFDHVTFAYNDEAAVGSAATGSAVHSAPSDSAAAAATAAAVGASVTGMPPAGASPASASSDAASLLIAVSDANGAGTTAVPTDAPPTDVVLRDVSFRLAPGRVLGLLGRTGSGKTTLTRLLFRLYDLDEGQIRLGRDGQLIDIRQLPLPELRHSVGIVTQNVQLFHATVRENLTFFNSAIPDERVLEAIRDLGLWAWYGSLAKGLDTELESGGGGLSAGEAQMLAFTRIFLHDPGLIILDEATSRLDPATEYLIERAVDKLVHHRTAIIVAHRLGTVQRADDILILQDGQICEYGARARLAQDPASRFYHLLQTGLEEVLA